MFEALPPTAELLGVLFLAGVIAYTLTDIVKNLLGSFLDRKGDVPDPWWWQSIFRVVPIVIGFLLGWPMLGLKWGGLVGAAGGVFSVLLYKKVSGWLETLKMPSP